MNEEPHTGTERWTRSINKDSNSLSLDFLILGDLLTSSPRMLKKSPILFHFILCLFRATPMAYASSQARGHIRLLAYTTATATLDPSCVWDLRHSSWQRWILNPLSEARDPTHNLTVLRRICFCCTTTGTPIFFFFNWTIVDLRRQVCGNDIRGPIKHFWVPRVADPLVTFSKPLLRPSLHARGAHSSRQGVPSSKKRSATVGIIHSPEFSSPGGLAVHREQVPSMQALEAWGHSAPWTTPLHPGSTFWHQEAQNDF